MVSTPQSPFSSTLPGHYYYDPAIYAQEQERIFARMWVCVGHVSRLPQSGDFFTLDLEQEHIIVVRGRDARIRAFLNVCRHRGARLQTATCGHLDGALQCRYHAWTYGLDGRLNGAPNIANMVDAGFDRDAFGLIPVALDVWEGWIWITLQPDPAPLVAQVEPLCVERMGSLERLARWGIGDLVVAQTITYDIAANWKLIVENFMECYHCATMHPEFCRLLPGFREGQIYDEGGAQLADDVEAFTTGGKGGFGRLPGLHDEDDRTYFGFILWPNMFVNLLPDHVVVHTLMPHDPARSTVECTWLVHREAAARRDFDPSGTIDAFDLVNRQDWEVCALTQLGMRSRAYRTGGIYVPVEQHIRSFSEFVLAKMGPD